MIAAAAAVPDHDLLRPWRFILIEGEGRHELAKTFMAIRKQRTPDIRPEELNRTWRKTMRAPTLLAVVSRISYDNLRVPAHEQYISVGAAAYAVMLTCHGLGYGAIMLSGSRSRHPLVRELLGLATEEQVVGFISIGTPAKTIAPKRRPGPDEFLQVWRGREA
jgi:nitroreductase